MSVDVDTMTGVGLDAVRDHTQVVVELANCGWCSAPGPGEAQERLENLPPVSDGSVSFTLAKVSAIRFS